MTISTVPHLSDNALTVLKNRYLREGETPSQLFWRVANAVAKAEKTPELQKEWAEKFYELMANLYFLPNSPTLVNAGTGKGCLSACFVCSPEDSLNSILETQKNWGMIEKWGGGVGMGLSKIRPKGDKIHTTHGRALGPVAIMEMYSTNANKITQGAFRMGAHMTMLSCLHPNLQDFIHCKDNDDTLSNFNISVQITDEFMRAVENDGPWNLVNPRNGEIVTTLKARDLWYEICESAWKTGDPGVAFMDRVWETQPNPQLGYIESSNPCLAEGTFVRVSYGWERIERVVEGDLIAVAFQDKNAKVKTAYNPVRFIEKHENYPIVKITFESGLEVRATLQHRFYLPDWSSEKQVTELKNGDKILCWHSQDAYQVISRIEPDGFATVYDLHEPVTDTWITEGGIINRGCGEEFLENFSSCNLGSIDLGKFTNYLETTINYRHLESVVRTSVRFLDDVIEVNEFPLPQLKEMNMKTRRIGLGIMGWADMLAHLQVPYDSEMAYKLAEEMGKFIKDVAIDESRLLAEEKGAFPEWQNSAVRNWYSFPMRNSSVLTIAPTGSVSLIADCSGGLEPYFHLAWKRKTLWKEQEGDYTEIVEMPSSLMTEVVKRSPIQDLQIIPTQIAEKPSEARKILENIGIDSSIYRTAMEISSEAHVRMQAAWQKNVTNSVSKTINMPNEATVEDVAEAFRLAWELGCKAVTVYRDGSKKQQVLDAGAEKEKKIQARPTKLTGHTERVNTAHGTLYFTQNFKRKNRPFEVFANLGKAGGCDNAYLEAITRMVSLALRSGISQKQIVKQLSGITCCPIWHEGHQIQSVPDAIAYVLSGGDEEMKNEFFKEQYNNKMNGHRCPSCGGELVHQSGCESCVECGFSKCD